MAAAMNSSGLGWPGGLITLGDRLVGHRTCPACLSEGRVRSTLEVVFHESPEHLQRRHDANTGLPLLWL